MFSPKHGCSDRCCVLRASERFRVRYVGENIVSIDHQRVLVWFLRSAPRLLHHNYTDSSYKYMSIKLVLIYSLIGSIKGILKKFSFAGLTLWGRHVMWTLFAMMTSSNGNIFRVTDHLCGEFTGPRWIPRTKASDAELWCFLWSAFFVMGIHRCKIR